MVPPRARAVEVADEDGRSNVDSEVGLVCVVLPREAVERRAHGVRVIDVEVAQDSDNAHHRPMGCSLSCVIATADGADAITLITTLDQDVAATALAECALSTDTMHAPESTTLFGGRSPGYIRAALALVAAGLILLVRALAKRKRHKTADTGAIRSPPGSPDAR